MHFLIITNIEIIFHKMKCVHGMIVQVYTLLTSLICAACCMYLQQSIGEQNTYFVRSGNDANKYYKNVVDYSLLIVIR
jgi:hypothetical protein